MTEATDTARLQRMRLNAKRRGLPVPSIEEIVRAVPSGMVCFVCQRHMNWALKDGRSTVATLQHDRSGAFRIICQGCNSKHSDLPGDTFYDLPAGHKFCQGCKVVKPVDEFSVDRSKVGGRKYQCKVCRREHYRKNADYWRQRRVCKRERD